ncbi:MAG: hypothetical protein Q8R55_04430 [Candidatus Taylorbacteria bacterium]|nr:hypothetical protein [Candidatus Taylorbacteria bacterium]
MLKNIHKLLVVGCLVVFSSMFASALTKPGSDADIDNLSYVFYLYYDNNQLFVDRDYEIKFDIVNEKFIAEPLLPAGSYKAEIFSFKPELVKTFNFDPRKGDAGFRTGKVQVRGPYVPDGSRVTLYNPQNNPVLNIFISEGSICNDDGICTSAENENEKTCPADCKQARPSRTVEPLPILDEGPDLTQILIYVFGGLGVAVGSWFGWRWWKKKRGENFLPPPPSGGPPPPPFSMPPPIS